MFFFISELYAATAQNQTLTTFSLFGNTLNFDGAINSTTPTSHPIEVILNKPNMLFKKSTE